MEDTTPVLAHLFMSHAPSIKYIFKDGTIANFTNHRYFTSVPAHISELKTEIEVHEHPSFYINPKEALVNPAEQDPMSRLRKLIIDEYLLAEAKKTNPQNDLGTTTLGRFVPTSTSDVAAVTANGDARSIQAKLAELLPNTK